MLTSLRELNLIFEIIAAVGVVPLMKAVLTPGEERKKLRPFVIYLPVLMWVVVFLLMISTGALITQHAPLTARTWIPMIIMLSIIFVQVMLVRKYRKLPRHSKSEAGRTKARELASRPPAVTYVSDPWIIANDSLVGLEVEPHHPEPV